MPPVVVGDEEGSVFCVERIVIGRYVEIARIRLQFVGSKGSEGRTMLVDPPLRHWGGMEC